MIQASVRAKWSRCPGETFEAKWSRRKGQGETIQLGLSRWNGACRVVFYELQDSGADILMLVAEGKGAVCACYCSAVLQVTWKPTSPYFDQGLRFAAMFTILKIALDTPGAEFAHADRLLATSAAGK